MYIAFQVYMFSNGRDYDKMSEFLHDDDNNDDAKAIAIPPFSPARWHGKHT